MSDPRRAFRLSARGSVDREVDDEIRFHLDSRIAELVAGGMDAVRAREQATREFGDADRARAEMAALDRHRAARADRHDWWAGCSWMRGSRSVRCGARPASPPRCCSR